MSKIKFILAAAGLALLSQAHAQSSARELRAALAESLPPYLGQDNTELAKKLLSVKIEGGISRGFDAAKVGKQLFGRAQALPAPDCTTKLTTQQEADEGLCVNENGKRDDPTGAYTVLAFSKNIGKGTVLFAKRPSFNPTGEPNIKPVRLTDTQAYDQALKFLELVGVPKSEIPVPPVGANLPVRSLAVGGGEKEELASMRSVISKVVKLPRAFVVPGGIYKDPRSGIVLEHAIAPGSATIMLNDSGLQSALVDEWSDAQIDPKLDARYAKSANALLDEIAEDLFAEGVREVGNVSFQIGFRKGYPHPDDPNPPLCPVCGVLRPALIVAISQVGRDEIKQPASVGPDQYIAVAPGVIREYDLIEDAVDLPAR